MKYFKLYKNTFNKINTKYQNFVKELVELIKIIDDIFEDQISEKKGVIQIASKKTNNDKFLTSSPFSVTLYKNKPIEIPYHKFYKDYYQLLSKQINLIINKINDGQIKIDNKKYWLLFFNNFKKCLVNDHWELLEKIFLETPQNSQFLFSIGPIERYHDKIFGVKRFFSGWLVFRENKNNSQYSKIWNELNNLSKKLPSLIQINLNRVVKNKLFFGDLIAEGGEVSKLYATGWSRPENDDLIQKYGSIKIIIKNKYEKKFKQEKKIVLGSLKNIKLAGYIKEGLKEFLAKYSFLPLIVHEFGHTLLKSSSAGQNLSKYYTFIEESRAQANMIYLINLLEKNKKIGNNITLMVILYEILRFPYLFNYYKKNNQRIEYLLSATIWFILALQLNIIGVNKGKLRLINPSKEILENYTTFLFGFFNSIYTFGHYQNKKIEEFYNFLYKKKKLLNNFF